jgi:hypothetical protein
MQSQRHKTNYMRPHYLTKSRVSSIANRREWQFQFDDSLISQRPKVEISGTISICMGRSQPLPYGITILYSKKASAGLIRVKPF